MWLGIFPIHHFKVVNIKFWKKKEANAVLNFITGKRIMEIMCSVFNRLQTFHINAHLKVWVTLMQCNDYRRKLIKLEKSKL